MDPSDIPPTMLEISPAMKPPAGHHTDFTDPGHDGSNTTSTIVVTAFLMGLTVIILLLRLYTKKFILHALGWDDYTAIGATVGAIAYSSVIFYLFTHGLGVHQWNVRLVTLLNLTDYMNAIMYLYKPTMLLAKLSLCIFFLNIFGTKPYLRWAVYFAIAYNVILQTTAFFLSIFICVPGRPSFWGCSDKVSVLNIYTSGFNIFIDFYMLSLPLFAISQLHMKSRRKVSLMLIFFAGTLACVASVLGLIYRVKQNASSDVTWNFAPEIILVSFELEATIMVGCLILLPSLFKSKHPLSFPSLWSSRSQIFKGRSSTSLDRSQNVQDISDGQGWNKESLESTEIYMPESASSRA